MLELILELLQLFLRRGPLGLAREEPSVRRSQSVFARDRQRQRVGLGRPLPGRKKVAFDPLSSHYQKLFGKAQSGKVPLPLASVRRGGTQVRSVRACQELKRSSERSFSVRTTPPPTILHATPRPGLPRMHS